MPPRKDRPNPKAEAALQRKVDQLREKQETAQRAAEDSKWADEGSTLKERRAAEKAEKDRQKAEAAAAKKQLRDAEDNQDAESEAARKRKHRVKSTVFELSTARERSTAARLAALEAERDARVNKLLVPVVDTDGDGDLPSNPNHERAAQLAADAERLGGAANVIEASDISSAIKALDIRSASLPLGERHPEKRRKAAYKAYEAKMIPQLKEEQLAEHGHALKYSQLKQMVFDMWKTAPENPMNQQSPV